MRVISTILTLSTMCSGVRFFPLHNGAMVSEEITNPDTYARFLKIPGFSVYEPTVRAVGEDAKPAHTGADPLIPIPGWDALGNPGGDDTQPPSPDAGQPADPDQPSSVVVAAGTADPSASTGTDLTAQAKPNQAKPSQAKPNQAKPNQAKPNQAKQPNKSS